MSYCSKELAEILGVREAIRAALPGLLCLAASELRSQSWADLACPLDVGWRFDPGLCLPPCVRKFGNPDSFVRVV